MRFKIIYIGFILSCFVTTGTFGQDTILTLERAINLALEKNYGIYISQLETNQAELNNHWGNAGRYPAIRFSGTSANNYSITNNTSLNNMLKADVNADWVLFNGFRVVSTKTQLEELENLTRGQSAVIVENTIEDVIMGYYLILLEMEKLKVFEKVLSLSEDRYLYEQKRYDLGSSVSYKVLQAKNNYLTDKISYISQQLAYRNAVRNLNFLMGLDSDSLIEWSYISEFQPDTSDYVFSDIKEKTLTQNQTIQNQYINLRIKEQDTRIRKSDYFPSVGLSSGITNQENYGINQGNISMGDPALNVYGNINISYNIFNGGKRKRSLEVARISEEIAQTDINEIQHVILNQLLNVYDMYTIRKEILMVSEDNLNTVALNLNIAEEKYKTGIINSFEYREVQLNYIQAAINKLQAVYNLLYSNTTLIRITGGFIDEN